MAVGVKETPLVSWTRAVVYHPVGVVTLHPVDLNGTGFSPNVIVNDAVALLGFVGPGDESFEQAAPTKSTVATVAIDATALTFLAPPKEQQDGLKILSCRSLDHESPV